MLGFLLGFVAAVTVAVAGWLFWVVNVILPQVDPMRIPFWTGVGFGFLGYGVLTWIYLMTGRAAPFRILLAALSLLGVACGTFLVAAQFFRPPDGGHFEGYPLLMGTILSTHGVLLFIHAVRHGFGRGARRR